MLVAARSGSTRIERDHGAALSPRDGLTPGTPASNHGAYASGTDSAHQHGVDGYDVRVAVPVASWDAPSPPCMDLLCRSRRLLLNCADRQLTVSLDHSHSCASGCAPPMTAHRQQRSRSSTPRSKSRRRAGRCGIATRRRLRRACRRPAIRRTGIGRAWPLLTGERAHYELAAGRGRREQLARAWRRWPVRTIFCRNRCGTAPTFPSEDCSSGSRIRDAARVGARRVPEVVPILRDGQVFDWPPQTVQRVSGEGDIRHTAGASTTRCARCRRKILRVETLAPAVVHWSGDGWRPCTRPQPATTMGVHVADLQTLDLRIGDRVDLTFNWPEAGRWKALILWCGVE